MNDLDKYADFISKKKTALKELKKNYKKSKESIELEISNAQELHDKDLIERFNSLRKYAKYSDDYDDYETTIPIEITLNVSNDIKTHYETCILVFSKISGKIQCVFFNYEKEVVDIDYDFEIINVVHNKIEWDDNFDHKKDFSKVYDYFMSEDLIPSLEANKLGLL